MFKAVAIDSLGETILIQMLSNAYYAMTKSPIIYQTKRIKESREDLIFIQNDSGIHKITTTFGLCYDSNKLQNMFFYYVHIA